MAQMTMLAIFSLSFLFLILTSPAGAQPEWVRDTDGRPLDAGAYYYILPAQFTSLGGLQSGSRNGKPCPLYVGPVGISTQDGVPSTFRPVSGANLVQLSTDLNIESNRSSGICAHQSTVWTLAPGKKGQTFVSYGGVAGNPGPATLSNWFRIDKEGDNYKLVFCPGVCSVCKVRCSNLGLYTDQNDNKWLAFDAGSFSVKFKRLVK